MEYDREVFVFLSPEVERFLTDNEIGLKDLFVKAGIKTNVKLGQDPVSNGEGRKEPATIILASAAVIAAATPILKELIKNLSGRETAVRERRLLPVEDSKGKTVLDASGEPILHWTNVAKAQDEADKITIKGFGVEISFGGR